MAVKFPALRKVLDDIEPHFHKGGKYENWFALYEAVDTIFLLSGSTTKTTAHVRDGVDLKRIMITVWFVPSQPCCLVCEYRFSG